MPTYTIRYRWQTTGMSQTLFEGIVAATPEDATATCFHESGHDNRDSFMHDLEAVEESA